MPVELFGRTELPEVGAAPYPLTVSGHGFYWLSLEPPRGAAARAAAWEPPAIEAGRDAALAEALSGWCAAQPWFSRPGRRVEEARVADVVPVGAAHLVILEAAYQDRERERWVVPLAVASGAEAAAISARARGAIVATVRAPGEAEGILYDAIADGPSAVALLETILTRGRLPGRAGEVVATPAGMERAPVSEAAGDGGALVVLGRRVLCDVARRLDEGPGPGLEIARFLAAHAAAGRAARVPELVASVEYAGPRAARGALFVIRSFVPSDGDALAHASAELGRYYERVLARGPEEPAPAPPGRDLLRAAIEGVPGPARDAVGPYADAAELLGRRTAELHLALASDPTEPAFAPEPYAPQDQRGAYQAARSLAGRCLHLVRTLSRPARAMPEPARAAAARVLAREDVIGPRLLALLARPLTALRTRRVGGLSLAGVLHAGNDFVFADLDGDRAEPLAVRRRKGSALRDAATLIRSYHEAAWSVLLDPARVRGPDCEAARPWAELWWRTALASLLRGYLDAAGDASFLPRGARRAPASLLDVLLLESAFAGALGALEAREAIRTGAARRRCSSSSRRSSPGGEGRWGAREPEGHPDRSSSRRSARPPGIEEDVPGESSQRGRSSRSERPPGNQLPGYTNEVLRTVQHRPAGGSGGRGDRRPKRLWERSSLRSFRPPLQSARRPRTVPKGLRENPGLHEQSPPDCRGPPRPEAAAHDGPGEADGSAVDPSARAGTPERALARTSRGPPAPGGGRP